MKERREDGEKGRRRTAEYFEVINDPKKNGHAARRKMMGKDGK